MRCSARRSGPSGEMSTASIFISFRLARGSSARLAARAAHLPEFAALQRRDIPSRLLVFPNENHWVLKPKNSRQWYREVLGWMNRWTRRAAE